MLATDRFEQAIVEAREAIRISPDDPSLSTWLFLIGGATRRLGREDEALGYFIRAANLAPTEEGFRAAVVSTYALLGRHAEAAASLREWHERRPEVTVGFFRRLTAFQSPYPGYQAGVERFLEGLRLAGLPEE